MTNKTFEYGGKHFVPVRKFNTQDGDFFKVTRKLRRDVELGFFADDYGHGQKFAYSYDDFYNAYGNKDCDIFKCVENGKLYIPCQYVLQRYEESTKNKNYER